MTSCSISRLASTATSILRQILGLGIGKHGMQAADGLFHVATLTGGGAPVQFAGRRSSGARRAEQAAFLR
ncbi:hypothetical protein B2G71_17480 [Novosphingobium sp. PC22D]|nr:hypothetical protein B2G71_17480 [Novosphingobium sp. PC22D]